MAQHNMSVIEARCGYEARLARARAAAWAIARSNRNQRPVGRVTDGNVTELRSSASSSVDLLTASPPSRCPNVLPSVSADTPSSKDNMMRAASRIARARPAQRVRFSNVEGRVIYDADEQTLPVRRDSSSCDQEGGRSNFMWSQRSGSMFACTLLSLLCFITLVLLFQLLGHAFPILTRREEPPNGTSI